MTDPVQPAQTGPAFEAYTPSFTPQDQQAAPAPFQPQPQPKKTGVVVLAVLVVLLLGAAGTFGALYFSEKSTATDLSKQVEGKDREITDLTKKVKESKDEATKAADAQKKAETEAAAAQKCRTASKTLMEAAIAQDDGKAEAAMKDIFTTC